MSQNMIYMDIPAVENISKRFEGISETLVAVETVLEMLSTTLKATAFVGLVGNLAVAQFIDSIRPHIEQMAEKCAELSSDVEAAVRAYERNDAQGSTRFH